MKNRPSDLVLVSRQLDVDLLTFLQKNPMWNTKGVVVMHFINAFQLKRRGIVRKRILQL